MCECTKPVRTGIGAVCVEYGRPKWPITMLNQTHTECFVFYVWHPMLVRRVMKRLCYHWKTKEKKTRFARAPHEKQTTQNFLANFCFCFALALKGLVCKLAVEHQIRYTKRVDLPPDVAVQVLSLVLGGVAYPW